MLTNHLSDTVRCLKAVYYSTEIIQKSLSKGHFRNPEPETRALWAEAGIVGSGLNSQAADIHS